MTVDPSTAVEAEAGNADVQMDVEVSDVDIAADAEPLQSSTQYPLRIGHRQITIIPSGTTCPDTNHNHNHNRPSQFFHAEPSGHSAHLEPILYVWDLVSQAKPSSLSFLQPTAFDTSALIPCTQLNLTEAQFAPRSARKLWHTWRFEQG